MIGSIPAMSPRSRASSAFLSCSVIPRFHLRHARVKNVMTTKIVARRVFLL